METSSTRCCQILNSQVRHVRGHAIIQCTHFALSIGSTPTVGSSRIMRGGCCNIATANENLLFCPPLQINSSNLTHTHDRPVERLLPQCSDKFVSSRQLQELLQELPPLSDTPQTHAMQNPKVVECLVHSEVTIQGHVLRKHAYSSLTIHSDRAWGKS